MNKAFEFLATTAGRIVTILTLLSLLVGFGFSFVNWQTSLVSKTELELQLRDIATKTEVAIEMNDLAIELVSVTIMGYEDELVELSFLVESGEATPMDRVKHQNTISRLNDLRTKLGRLEDTAVELQRADSRIADDIRTGSQVTE